MSKKAITVGADPEFFITSKTNGKVVPVCGLVGGTKAKPITLKVESSGRSKAHTGFAYQEDNVALELNVPPSNDPHMFAHNISLGIRALQEMLDPKGYSLQPITPATQFTKGELAHPLAATFGCAPDYDAYTDGDPFPKIEPEALITGTKAWRFVGGHIHIGYDLDLPPFVVASFMDVALGLKLVSYGEQQGERRKLYGQAGRYRPTSYGLEYRTPSSYWCWDMDLSHSLAHSAMSMVVSLSKDVATIKRWFAEIPWHDVQQAINKEDARLAGRLESYIKSEVMA